ncbi:histidine phosphatase family protein [Candidatus Thiosymbion oneisti]|uniref:histidine phosphatase family protein n=1 Tax=Candidatus Thiosymbion oneisti TaxID=589554 RepID=UPI0010613E33|nr:histidine phosphatase family protein [Candidatus Thiosymbion oneisti]
MSTRITLIRHGETDWNAEGRLQGHLQVLLNRRGRAQAEALATCLQDTGFDAVYSSDLLRALQTAWTIVRYNGQQVRADARLREWDLGVLVGLSRAQAERDQPQATRIRREHLVDEPIPGGESLRRRFERVTGAVAEIAARHRGECILVVSHGGPLGDCYRRAVGKGIEERMRIDLRNATINRIDIDGNDWTVRSWAQTEHLAAVGLLPS